MVNTRKKMHSVDIVSDDVYNVLSVAAKNQGKSIRSFTNNLLSDVVKSREFFQNKFQHLKKISQDNGRAHIVDEMRNGNVATVTVNNGRLECSICEEDLICDHITYTMVDPEFWEMLQNHNK